MVNNDLFNASSVIDSLKTLNEKYRTYLADEGKWLIGGFESLIAVEPNSGQSGSEQYVLKKEIYMMLPAEIREDIAQFMNVD